MNIIYKIFYMLVGRSIESELRTNKIVKLRYDFINERKRDILFLLHFFISFMSNLVTKVNILGMNFLAL